MKINFRKTDVDESKNSESALDLDRPSIKTEFPSSLS